MSDYKLNEVEEKLIDKYQLTKSQDIAMYFFNKLGNDVLNIIYSKIQLKFSSIPLERNDLVVYVWKSLEKCLELCKNNKKQWWGIWVNQTYSSSVREIQKYFKNTELILNYAESWDKYTQDHCIYNTAKSMIEMPKNNFRDVVKPIVEYVATHNKTYSRASIKKLLYLKSFGYSEREIAKKMHVSRRYIASMIKVVARISKRYLRASNR